MVLGWGINLSYKVFTPVGLIKMSNNLNGTLGSQFDALI